MSQTLGGTNRIPIEQSRTDRSSRLSWDQADLVRRMYSGHLMPDEMLAASARTEDMFPTRTIRRGDRVAPLPLGTNALADMRFESGGKQLDIYDFISRNLITGLIVLKSGTVVCETYQFGLTPGSRWMSMSMAKSISTTLVGAAIKDGLIESVDDPVAHYVKELQGGAYDGVSIKQLLQMTSGVGWIETHTDPASHRRHMLELQIAQESGTILRFMAGLERAATPGTRWNYSTGETHVVGALLRAAIGRPIADYLSEKIWSKVGMESDAAWWLESPDGLEVAGSGITATLRDYARFGLFVMNDGVVGCEHVLPDGWVNEACSSRIVGGAKLDYGYMWWVVPAPAGSAGEGGFTARGNFGQRIYVNQREKVVMVMWSARSKPLGAEAILDNDFFNAAVELLR